MSNFEEAKRLMRINKNLINPQITQIFTDFLKKYFVFICGNLRNLRIYNLLFPFFLLLFIASKPIPPIDVIIGLSKQPVVPGIAIVNLKVIPLIEHSNIDIQMEIPEKLRLISGTKKWNGILEVDKTETFEYQIYIPDSKAYEVKTVIILKMSTGESVRREETLEINPVAKKNEYKKNHIKEGKDRGVIEFKGE